MLRVHDTKERLLEAGIDLLWEESLGTASVDAICRRAGVKKGSFYHFFKSKAELVVAAMEANWQGVRAQYDRIFSPSLPPLERLQKYFEWAYARQLQIKERAGRVLGCPYTSIGTACTKEDQAIREKVKELLKTTSRYIETAIRDGQADGSIPVRDVQAAAEALFDYVHGALTQARIQNDLRPIQNLAKGAFGLLGAAPDRAQASTEAAR